MTLANWKNVFVSVIAVTVILYFGRPILVPILFALFMFFLLSSIESWIMRKVKSKSVSIFLSYTLVIVVILSFVGIFVWKMNAIAQEFNQDTFTENTILVIQDNVSQYLEKTFPQNFLMNQNQLINAILDVLFLGLEYLIKAIGDFLSNIFLSLVLLFFMLVNGRRIKQFVVKSFSLPEDFWYELESTVQSYIKGISLVAIIMWILSSIVFLIVGIQHAFFFGFLLGIMSALPYVGTLISGSISMIYILLQGYSISILMIVAASLIVLYTLEGNFITPRILGEQLKINSLVTVIALFCGGILWGMSGVILALPIVATVKIIYSYRKSSKKFFA